MTAKNGSCLYKKGWCCFTSEPQEKLPESSLRALNLKLPPLTRTRRTVTFEDNLVLPGWRPNSYLNRCQCTSTSDEYPVKTAVFVDAY